MGLISRHIERAPAKVNLALHVVGKRSDGYHLLESLVMFTHDIADVITIDAIENSSTIFLEVKGLFAKDLALACPDFHDNIAYKAALLLKRRCNIEIGTSICIEKNIPLQAGLGGGSADAAAVLRGLNHVWGVNLSEHALAQIGEQLGADVPMCVYSRLLIASGIGEEIQLNSSKASLPVVLIKPQCNLSTADVFRALVLPENSLKVSIQSLTSDCASWTMDSWSKNLQLMRNDLMPASSLIEPVIDDVIQMLSGIDGVVLSRMSGSGSACFALCESIAAAQHIEASIKAAHPNWWIKNGKLS